MAMMLLTLLTACHNRQSAGNSQPAAASDTTHVEEQREVMTFHSVDIAGASVVDIKIGPACSLKVSGTKSDAAASKTISENGALSVKYDEESPEGGHTRIDITAPTLDDIRLSNCGKVTLSGNPIGGDTFRLSLNHLTVAFCNAPVSAKHTTVSLENLMMAQMAFKGGAVDISSDHIEHARLTGSVSAIRVQGTAAEKVDRSSLKIR
jgi:hypothetical protein